MKNDWSERIVCISWCPEDVKEQRPEWSYKKCVEWLRENEERIRDGSVEFGWDIINGMLDEEPK